ncbi:MAG TPA: hypothetical protein VHT75_05050 [Acidimicrobiales bacterium]|jgi:hypothetical protein|nr:hypothetical protein [Acidimicrobiales bacterium]
MFAVYCSGHQGRVLLFPEHIERLVNRHDGVELQWRCTCGGTGIHFIARADDAEVAA